MESTPGNDKKICPVCGKEFVPYISGQIFCSKSCGKTAKYAIERDTLAVGKSIARRKSMREKESNEKLLSISAAARFLNVSRPTIYSCIESGVLSPVPFSEKSVRIPMSQLVLLQKSTPDPVMNVPGTSISKDDALKRYSISETWLYRKTKAHGVSSIIVKGKAYFPKDDLDRLFPPRSAYDRSKWYTVDDLVQAQGLTDKRILTIVSEHKIETARVFRELPKVATQKAAGSGQKTVRRQLFLDALPDEFDRQTFIEISSRLGMPLSTAERNIKKWTDEGLLIRQDLGHYKKTGK